MEKLGLGDPQRIGSYRLLARLGAGGMGQVYVARSDRGRTVAVKLVREELAAQDEFRARFRQEVRAARQVGGYWTAPVLDADTEAPVPWVATGYVAGPSLQQIVGHDHGALPERTVRILAVGLAHALKDVHAAGIVHRDLKPSNVLLTIDGPRVIDFGIARALETVTDGGLTRTGALVGSPGFMAPEQVRGDRITPACDVFCLGSVLAYAATGKLPFGTANSGVHALMFRIAQEEPDLAGVPESIADLVRECLRKVPEARPTLDSILQRTGAEDTVAGGRSRDPWLPGELVAQLGRHAVRLLDTEDPEGAGTGAGPGAGTSQAAAAGQPGSAGRPPAEARTPVPAQADGPHGAGQAGAGQAGATGLPGDASGGPAGGAAGPAPGPSHGASPGTDAVRGPAPGAPAALGVTPGAAPGPSSAAAGPLPGPGLAASPEHGAAGDESAPAMPPGPPVPGQPGSGARTDHLPTVVAGQGVQTPPPGSAGGAGRPGDPKGPGGPGHPGAPPSPPTPTAFADGAPGSAPAHPAYGYPQQHPQPSAYGHPRQPGAWPTGPGAQGTTPPYQQHGTASPYVQYDGPGRTPPYGPPTVLAPPYGPTAPQDPRRNSRSTAVLVLVALVVALLAGGSVFAVMNGGGEDQADGTSGPSPSVSASTTPGPPTPDPTTPGPSPSTTSAPPADGAIPAGYLGTWAATIDNADGRHTRSLTLQQGEAGDAVLSLVADGPTADGTYHCVFQAELVDVADGSGALRIGPSTVTDGQPRSSCSPGAASEVTLLPDGSLQRTNTGTDEKLTYTRR
ncbi:serine/threonine-protein kinase [Streptomyces sp. ALI-76-A]|uniref:serine/threonine-protein kinase n=1 Tax=Streptomyces sp. ALI-76-A TaxID=3025736 RepID=UPI00256EA7F2|nr:serine/threonine-protein kinase [Streptomyces sp. ALI-76-A]MDL5202851.1 protein kinase [Streptomyces sp. ALI-76-A]